MFTKEQLEALRGPKGDTGEQGPKGDTPSLDGYATEDYVTEAIKNKAEVGASYTKAEANALLDAKANIVDVEALLNGKKIGFGQGKTKKAAEQEAARKALEILAGK